MELFETSIVKYQNGVLSLDEACEHIQQWASTHSNQKVRELASDYLGSLYTAHQIGESVHKRMLQALHASSPAELPTDDDADETVMSKSPDISDDATVVIKPAVDDDATMIAPGPDDATVVMPRAEPAAEITQDDGFSIRTSSGDDSKLKPGSIIKDRFNLVSILGEGGMGRVYKAIDMLKVEAKDSNPYVAIKVLSEDFKEHPDAFVALQRETSKAQKLAHPNISTVYDFDRYQDTVYMTMELLEGVPLDKFIKSMPEGGLDPEIALGIVQDLGAGLGYAHTQGLVHSDFKPGNAFYLDDGSVKVIDFGIARAAAAGASDTPASRRVASGGSTGVPKPAYVNADISQRTDTTGRTSTTTGKYQDEVFDAGSLGALTPAYATIEMFEGQAPHPSDDIYALACVAVQLLTGKHPYNKRSAVKARELKMTPPVIPGLTKRQQRALDKALEFTRDKRTASMEEFLDGIRKRKSYVRQIVLGTLGTLAIIAAVGYKPVTNYYEQQEIDQIIANANNGPVVVLQQTLQSLSSYPPEKSATIKSGIRDKALQMYMTQINRAVDFEREKYDFAQSDAIIREALGYYPDSAAIKELSSSIIASREKLSAELRTRFMQQLLAKHFYVDDENPDLPEVMAQLGIMSPGDILFEDPRLENGFYEAASKAISDNQPALALQTIDIARAYLPDSKLFRNLGDSVHLAQLRSAVDAEIARVTENWKQHAVSKEFYADHLDDLLVLSLYTGRDNSLYNEFLNYFDSEFDLVVRDLPQQARKLLETFAPVLTLERISRFSADLGLQADTSTKPEALVKLDFIRDSTSTEDYRKQLSALRNSVYRLQNNALTHYNIAYAEEAGILAEQARPLLIEFYNTLYMPLFIEDTRQSNQALLTSANERYTTALGDSRLSSGVENDKRIFRKIASQNRLEDSKQLYNKIVKITDDKEFLEFARTEIARMYVTLAESNATEEDYQNAFKYINEAVKYHTSDDIEERRMEYRKQVITDSIAPLVLTQDENDRAEAIKQLALLKNEYADDYPFLVNRIAARINEDIIIKASENLLDAHKLKDYALGVVNSRIIRNVNIKDLPKPSVLALQGKIEVSQFNLSAAKATLAKALEKEPDHYQVAEFRELLDAQVVVAKKLYDEYSKFYRAEKYRNADAKLSAALSAWKDNPEYRKERSYYDRVMRQVNAGAKFCREDIKGIGKQSRGTCNDMILSASKQVAPPMVVVPAVSAKTEPYAISKYEISTAELKTFCKLSSKCTLSAGIDDNLPATRVPLDIINSYTDWLSDQTGFNYRIASRTEWVNAASAAGREGNSNYNCRLRLGSKLIKGQDMVPVQSGTANNWGLINYVGNADELITTPDGYSLIGGNFTDSISDCKVTLEKAVEGNYEYAGFRLVRDLF